MAVDKPHAVCIPYPAQGHMTPMLKLAKLLHFHGFHITYVSTEYNHSRLLKSRGPSSLDGLSDFRFETIPDGLPSTGDIDATQDIPALCESTQVNCLAPFRHLLSKLNDPSSGSPPVSCIVSDGVMSFTLDAAKELGIPEVLFWTTSACGLMGYLHYRHLLERGIFPFKEEELTNGCLDTPIDWVPAMTNIRLRDFPSFIRTTNPDDIMFNFLNHETDRLSMSSALILNTFDGLERSVLDAMSAILKPPIFTLGPLASLNRHIPGGSLASLGSNLWKEDTNVISWLEGREPGSVVYVNFGSITVMSNEQLIEFAWGLANSNQDFLWVIRPDLVKGDSAVLPPEFVTDVSGRSLMASWCPQEEVLAHPTVGGFLTHNGWNSTLESLTTGVPMLCWPFFAEQQTNCRYSCVEWGVGMEIDNNVKREEVEELIRELMGGKKGKEMKRRAMEWKESAARASEVGGTSFVNLEKLVREVLLGSSQDVQRRRRRRRIVRLIIKFFSSFLCVILVRIHRVELLEYRRLVHV